jgi:hypothetical protein
MKIRIVDKYIVATKDLPEEPKERLASLKEGDLLCGLQVGLKGIIPRKRFFRTYTNDPAGRLGAICHGTEKVIFKIRFKL